MKRRLPFIVLLLILTGLHACSGWTDGVDLIIDDPQAMPWVEDIIDDSLLNIIDNNNVNFEIHFGHTPPNLDSVSFIIDQLWYDTCIRYRMVHHPFLGDTVMPSYNNPGFESSVYKHHFYDPYGSMIHQTFYIRDHMGNESMIEADSTFVIGSGNDFTVYFKFDIDSQKEGYPTWAYLISGTLEYTYDTTVKITKTDTIVSIKKRLLGVSDYHIGKKIMRTDPENPPTQGYYQGTLMFLRPYQSLASDTIKPYTVWDTITPKSHS